MNKFRINGIVGGKARKGVIYVVLDTSVVNLMILDLGVHHTGTGYIETG